LRRRFGTGAGSAVKALQRHGLIEVKDEIQGREPWEDQEIVSTRPLQLNEEQEGAMTQVRERMDADSPGVILIHGVTGSGKTEVYLQAIERVLKAGKGAIMMVPEISLTPQTVERFRSRLGDTVAVLHSNLSQGERHDEWHRLRSGDARVVVGARSAVFAPVADLGLIVVDEEHEGSYKQGDTPRYNARDLAVVRGAMEKALVLLGSATPSVESSFNARNGKYGLAELTRRVEGTVMPTIRVLDMRGANDGGAAPAVFSRALLHGLEERLERGEQSIIFLNRRGHSSSLCCPHCGTVVECPNCSLPLTYHRDGEFMLCHYCDHRQPPPKICPQDSCRSSAIRYGGVGTQRVELVLRKLLPKARIARLDSDSMTRKDRFIEILGDFRKGNLDILVGTQMIAKGLHFPNVTLVGIIQADMGLHRPDFRAGERTFQLLTQVAGRAGRGDEPGEVFVQSYTPFHPAIQFAYRQDYEGFYQEEIEVRRTLALPPWSHMVLIEALGPEEPEVEAEISAIADEMRSWKEPVMQISGPSPAPIARLRGEYRFQILVRTRRVLSLVDRLKPLYQQIRKRRGIRWLVNVDPGQLM
jgi:primosomal protein N' (replication factor Y)